eukprot:gene12703-8665_t
MILRSHRLTNPDKIRITKGLSRVFDLLYFILYDFVFDFVVCITFIFVFVIVFFLRIFFSFVFVLLFIVFFGNFALSGVFNILSHSHVCLLFYLDLMLVFFIVFINQKSCLLSKVLFNNFIIRFYIFSITIFPYMFRFPFNKFYNVYYSMYNNNFSF